MCRWLNIPRSSYYYKAVEPVSEVELEEMVKVNDLLFELIDKVTVDFSRHRMSSIFFSVEPFIISA